MLRKKIILLVSLLSLISIVLALPPQKAYALGKTDNAPAVQIYLPMISSDAGGTTPPPPPANRGFFALSDFLTYNAATAVDAHGGVHLAFYTSDERHQDNPRGQPAYYTYCAGPVTACADPSKWSSLVQMDSAVNEVQIVVTAEGNPRILVRRNGNRGYDYDFYACNQQCADGQNWTGLLLTQAAGVESHNAELPQHSLTLDSQGRPRLVYSNGWGNGRPSGVYYTWCDAADCTEPGSWQETLVWGNWETATITSDYISLVLDGDKPRFVTRWNRSGVPEQVDYFECNAECGSQAKWSSTQLRNPNGVLWANWDLALDADGHPRVALYEPVNIDIHVTGKLYYAACDTNCTSQDSPFQMVQIANGEGKNVDLVIDDQGRTHMVYDAGQRAPLAEVWCDANCMSAEQWQQRVLETNATLETEFPVAIPFSCDQEERSWTDAIPQVAFSAQGQMVVAYDIVHYAVCYYQDPTNPQKPPERHVDRIWWAVRWALFDRL